MVMIHGDEKGLVLPPRVATTQVVIIPVPYKDVDSTAMLDACRKVAETLEASGLRVKEDTRDNYPPGWKYSDWELKEFLFELRLVPKILKRIRYGWHMTIMSKCHFSLPEYLKCDTNLLNSCNARVF